MLSKNNTWIPGPRLDTPRAFAEMGIFSPDELWISGGDKLDSSSLLKAGRSIFQPFLHLPEILSDHFVLKVDENLYVIMGTDTVGIGVSKRSYLFNRAEESFTPLPAMRIARRYAQIGKEHSAYSGHSIFVGTVDSA